MDPTLSVVQDSMHVVAFDCICIDPTDSRACRKLAEGSFAFGFASEERCIRLEVHHHEWSSGVASTGGRGWLSDQEYGSLLRSARGTAENDLLGWSKFDSRFSSFGLSLSTCLSD